MTEEDYDKIESLIGYEFKRRDLLQQAFTRKSYTNETNDGDNNEVLEFIGDKALDFVVVKALSEYYGEINNRDEFACDLTEGKLTELKKRFVESTMLAHCIDELELSQYLIMGKGDKKNNVQNDTHVKEDLFEAIMGAVAIDSGWDIDALQDVAELMLNIDYHLEHGFDNEENYVMLTQQWCQKTSGELPWYRFYDGEFDYSNNRRAIRYQGERVIISGGRGGIICELRIDNGAPFLGRGNSKCQARAVAAKLAYDYLDKHNELITMVDEIGDPSYENAVSQLQELAQKGYYSMPDYVFDERHDDDGNPVWRCDCRVAEYKYSYWAERSTKKEAKRQAAYDMLMSILNANGDDNDNDWDD